MKDILASKTIVGLLIAVLGPLATRYGIDNSLLETALTVLLTGGGSVMAIYGRIVATKAIGSVAGFKL